MRPRGREAAPPKLIFAEMSTVVYAEASGRIFFSILNIKETRKSVKLYYIMVCLLPSISIFHIFIDNEINN